MGFNLGRMSFETNQWTTKPRDFFSGPKVADEPLLWFKTSIRQFAHTVRCYGNGALLVCLPVIRLFPSFSQVLPVCFGYTTAGRDRGRS